MKLYLSGPMTGRPQLNYPAFFEEATRLRTLGYTVMNPAELGLNMDVPWSECMRSAVRLLLDCQGVAMLPAWQGSRGARLERRLAEELHMLVLDAHSIELGPQ